MNTSVNPPQSSWVHPGAQGFAPPPGPPPPDNRGYNPSPYPPQGGYNQGPPPQQWGGGYGGPGYQQPPPQEQRGTWHGRHFENSAHLFAGWFGGGRPAQPTQVVYEQAPPKKSGMGMGTVALAGKPRSACYWRYRANRALVLQLVVALSVECCLKMRSTTMMTASKSRPTTKVCTLFRNTGIALADWYFIQASITVRTTTMEVTVEATGDSIHLLPSPVPFSFSTLFTTTDWYVFYVINKCNM